MPDVNLLQNNKEPEEHPAARPSRPELPLSDPGAQKGIGGVFRSLFAKKLTPIKTATASLPQGTGVRAQQQSTERILSEKRTAGPMVQLPEEDEDFQVNLLSEDVVSHVHPRQKFIQLGLIALGTILVIVVADVGLGIYKSTVDKDLQATQAKVSSTAVTVADLQKQTERISSVTDRTKAISTLLNNHVYWTQFFARLEKYTLRSVSYGSDFAGSLQGSVQFSAKTDTYEDVAKQYLLLQQAVQAGDFISSFSIVGATRTSSKDQSQVDFAISVVLVPGAFNAPSTSTHPTSTDTGSQSAAARLADINDGKCYLAAHANALTSFPAVLRSPFTTLSPTFTATTCATMSAANLQRGQTLVSTDTDNDGLNDFLEVVIGTSPTKTDTNQNGKTDLQDVLACQNAVTTAGTIPNCDPANPLGNIVQ